MGKAVQPPNFAASEWIRRNLLWLLAVLVAAAIAAPIVFHQDRGIAVISACGTLISAVTSIFAFLAAESSRETAWEARRAFVLVHRPRVQFFGNNQPPSGGPFSIAPEEGCPRLIDVAIRWVDVAGKNHLVPLPEPGGFELPGIGSVSEYFPLVNAAELWIEVTDAITMTRWHAPIIRPGGGAVQAVPVDHTRPFFVPADI